MIIDEDEYFEHQGTKRHSGRYPWGSGGDDVTRSQDFLGTIAEMRTQGLKDRDIARGMGMKSTEFRQRISAERNAKKLAAIGQAQLLRDRGWSNVKIGERMGINESSVRDLLTERAKDRAKVLNATVDLIREQIEKKKHVDVGSGVEHHINVSRGKLNTAVRALMDEGYPIHYLKVDQMTGSGQQTSVKVLSAPGTTYSDLLKNRDNVQQISGYSQDGGRSYDAIQPPISISSKRLKVLYAEEGGRDADGVIFIRPGIDDISLEHSRYAQVRVAVDGTHYLKGMAMYRDDLPRGVDLMFNTNKSSTGNKLDALKPMKKIKNTEEVDKDDPFGAMIKRQIGHPDPSDGTKKIITSAMNIVNEEKDWGDWSRSLSSQFLAKQSRSLAKNQLAETLDRKRKEFNEIQELTNPIVRRKLLDAFASGADSSAVNLKAAALPNQGTHVILPLKTIGEREIYAPNYDTGTQVVLVRFPHAGIFEIPEVTVNNRNPEGRKLLGEHAPDAIGIHPKVAERLSGADFDGDTVLVIPNPHGAIKTAPMLERLKGFDPQASYKGYPGMPEMSPKSKGTEMGKISNLITDMTVQKAPLSEIVNAVRHSMVVIDAEKHKLNYKQSAIDHGIPALKKKYQSKPDGTVGGAKTLLSRAKSEVPVDDRKLRRASKGGPIDPKTGELVYEYSGETYTQRKTRKKVNKKTGEVTVTVTEKEVNKPGGKSTQLAEAKDARELSSGTRIENIYADHSNSLKELANQARLASTRIKGTPASPSAARAYSEQVARLNSALLIALKNSPLERQALVIANGVVRLKRQDNPNLDKGEIKKLRAKAIETARLRTGAKKTRIEIKPDEWDAIQAGAISTSKLEQILNNADLDVVKQLATPRGSVVMDSQAKAKALRLLSSNHTQAEVAAALGMSVSSLKRGLSE